jgi:tight adherence protein C
MFPAIPAETLHNLVAREFGWQFGPLRFSLIEAVVVLVAVGAALISAFGLWRIGTREDRQARLVTVRRAVVRPGAEQPPGPRWYVRLGELLMATPVIRLAGRQRLVAALHEAGIRGENSLAGFLACKIGGALAFAGLSWWTISGLAVAAGAPVLLWGNVAAALFLGSYAPELVLTRLTIRRRRRLEHGFPDALDLLVICTEAGLGLPQAVEEIARALQKPAPEIAAEFAMTAAEFKILPDRAMALDNMVRRTGIESLRNLTATLNQSLRFGTSLADSLRTLSSDMRAARMAHIEEGAARLPVLLSIPLMLFLMPALLLVIMSPVALKIADMVSRDGSGQ